MYTYARVIPGADLDPSIKPIIFPYIDLNLQTLAPDRQAGMVAAAAAAAAAGGVGGVAAANMSGHFGGVCVCVWGGSGEWVLLVNGAGERRGEVGGGGRN